MQLCRWVKFKLREEILSNKITNIKSFMKLDYTTRARGIAYKHPLLTNIGIQINFWIIAYVIYFLLLFFISKALTSLYPQKVETYLGENIIVAIIAAIIFGTILGIVDLFIVEFLDSIKLKGKEQEVKLYSVDANNSSS